MVCGMSRNSRARRHARAKNRHQRGPTPPRTDRSGGEAFVRQEEPFPSWPPPGWSAEHRRQTEALELIERLVRHGLLCPARDLINAVRWELKGQLPALLEVMDELVVDELMARLAAAWEHGWQPRDLRHAAAQRGGRLALLASALIVTQATRTGVATRAPESWQDQVRSATEGAGALDLAAQTPADAMGALGVPLAQAWTDLVLLIKLLAELPRLAPIGPTPSQWGRGPQPVRNTGSIERDRMLNKIRALLAKAEATTHAAEAETFTAKAQDLMTRHAIDEALLHADSDTSVPVLTRRVHLESPYTAAKALLLDAVGRPNRTRVVFHAEHAFCTVIGPPVDVDHVEMLFTSLLIQATRAMTEAGGRPVGSFDRSATFRRSFLSAYAVRIGERLTEADQSATASYGADLVPILRRQVDAVDAEFERQFPRTVSKRAGYLDARGWSAGRAAADQARLTAGRLTA